MSDERNASRVAPLVLLIGAVLILGVLVMRPEPAQPAAPGTLRIDDPGATGTALADPEPPASETISVDPDATIMMDAFLSEFSHVLPRSDASGIRDALTILERRFRVSGRYLEFANALEAADAGGRITAKIGVFFPGPAGESITARGHQVRDASVFLVWVRLQLGAPHSAHRLAETLVRLRPDNPDAHLLNALTTISTQPQDQLDMYKLRGLLQRTIDLEPEYEGFEWNSTELKEQINMIEQRIGPPPPKRTTPALDQRSGEAIRKAVTRAATALITGTSPGNDSPPATDNPPAPDSGGSSDSTADPVPVPRDAADDGNSPASDGESEGPQEDATPAPTPSPTNAPDSGTGKEAADSAPAPSDDGETDQTDSESDPGSDSTTPDAAPQP